MVEPKARVLTVWAFLQECKNSGVEMSVRNKEAPPAQEYEVEKILLEKAV